MMLKFSIVSLLSLLLSENTSIAYTVDPVINNAGQALTITCDPSLETTCQTICNQPGSCVVQESDCRNCAGTEDLRLKLILDGVGTKIIASTQVLPESSLIKIFKSNHFMSVHPMTLYNYSSVYNGDQINAQFRALCPGVPVFAPQSGILLIDINPLTHQPTSISGAICPGISTTSFEFHSIAR